MTMQTELDYFQNQVLLLEVEKEAVERENARLLEQNIAFKGHILRLLEDKKRLRDKNTSLHQEVEQYCNQLCEVHDYVDELLLGPCKKQGG